jgi:MFS family permease
MAFYYILKWIPKIVVDMGYAPPLAGGVLVWANVGGAVGAVLLGLLSQKIDVKALVIGALVLSIGMLTVFGLGYDTLLELSVVAALTGFCTNAAVVGLYALMASYLPTELRAGGTGFVIGVGRGGAALGPIVAGIMFAGGAGLLQVSLAMAGGSALALAALLALRKPKAA